MAKHPLRSLPLSLLALIGVMVLGATASSPSPAESAIPRAAPSARPPTGDSDAGDLICHTDDPAECYPKLFQATHSFQRVHPDQDLPKGLHVRLNVQTGEKEAKINVPDEPVHPSLQGLPVDQSIVLVDADPNPDDDKPPIPANAPRYDPVGKIKEPRRGADASSSGADAFHRSLQFLRKGLDVDQALEMLEDVSHDIYYGLKVAEDPPTVRQLFCLAYHPAPSAPPSRARLAALALGSAVQNNPKALAEVSAHWTRALRADPTCPAAAAFHLGADPALAKARAAALSGLLRDPVIRADFLASGAMEASLLDALVRRADEDGWESARRAVANLVLDNFLDESMGAALGEFPRGPRASDAKCAAATAEEGLEAACWDWHAERLARRHKGEGADHWSGELAKKVREQRKANNSRKEEKGKKGKKKEEL
jgi:nucleotide exchange factor SIL1